MTNKGGTNDHSKAFKIDRVSTYTGLDDYDTLFAARHGRGALEPASRMSEEMIMTTFVGITPHYAHRNDGRPIGKGNAFP